MTIPSNDDAANVDVTFVFGLISPYVDRSQADLTAFTDGIHCRTDLRDDQGEIALNEGWLRSCLAST